MSTPQITKNITTILEENGTHIFNYTCDKCWNISNECPMPIQYTHSIYNVNWIFLVILATIIIFLMARFADNIWLAYGLSMTALVLLCLIGAYYKMISGLLMVIIVILLSLYSLWKYKELIGL